MVRFLFFSCRCQLNVFEYDLEPHEVNKLELFLMEQLGKVLQNIYAPE